MGESGTGSSTRDDEEPSEGPLRAVRLKADAYCQDRMRALMQEGREAVAQLRAVLGPYAGGQPVPAEIEAVAQEHRDRAALCRQHFVIHAVRGMVLSGRLPEEREGEAWERCADDDGLMAFLDEMSCVPVGFVDGPTTEPARH